MRMLRYQFVQNAVNKVTALSLGPVTIAGLGGRSRRARIALAGTLELPATRDEQDTTTCPAS